MSKQSYSVSNDRRRFLKTVSLAGISGFLLPHHLQAEIQAKSRVIIVEDSTATSGNSINSSVVQTMINSGIKSLAQNNDIDQAWKILLPGVSATSVIAIKVNCLFTLCTHPEVSYAVANSLMQMMFSGSSFPANNIIIYDNSDSCLTGNGGYTINRSTTGVRCMGTGFSGSYDVSGVTQQLSTILTNTADFLINVAVLKNHGMSGVSLCLKNHYGTCNNPGGLHGGNYCDPYIPALNATTPIKTKQKVNIIDALFGIISGGPGGPPGITANKIIMSTDSVATDYCGKVLLKDKGCTATDTAYHIDTAATTYALGTNDPANMDIVNITNPSSGILSDEASIPYETRLYQNYPNPFNPVTHIHYAVAHSGRVVLNVYDIAGKEIATLVDGFLPAGIHTAIFNGHGLSSGTYIYRLHTAGAILSQKMVLAK